MYHAAMGMQGAAAALLSPGQMVTGGMWPQRHRGPGPGLLHRLRCWDLVSSADGSQQ